MMGESYIQSAAGHSNHLMLTDLDYFENEIKRLFEGHSGQIAKQKNELEWLKD